MYLEFYFVLLYLLITTTCFYTFSPLIFIKGDVMVVWWLDIQLFMPINTKIVSANPTHGDVYSINLMS